MSLPDLQEPLALLKQKDLDAAIEVLTQKVNALPAHLAAHVLLARAYEAQQRWERALRSWEDAHFLMPNSPTVKEGKRRVLRRMDGIETSGQSMVTPEPEAEEEEPSTDVSPELAQLRRQAEREARQGGARPGLADELASASSSEPSSSTPEEQVETLEEEGTADDLDRLIDELESARIEPDPDAEEAPAPEPEGEEEEVVSETLAQIHEGQNNYRKAARIYTKLAAQEPDRAEEFRQKADEMCEKANAADEDA